MLRKDIRPVQARHRDRVITGSAGEIRGQYAYTARAGGCVWGYD